MDPTAPSLVVIDRSRWSRSIVAGGRDRRNAHAASGWEKRRFNPAFQLLLRFIPDGRVSREIQPDYPSSSVFLLAEDKALLRRFVAEAV